MAFATFLVLALLASRRFPVVPKSFQGPCGRQVIDRPKETA